MADRTQAGIAALKQFAMRLKLRQRSRMRREMLWGVAAAAALVCAVVSGLGDAGAQRAAIVLSSLKFLSAGQAQPQPSQFNAEAATRQIVITLQGLAEDRDRLTARLDTLEQHMDDMTGSISRQIEAAKTASAQAAEQQQPWPSQAPPLADLPASVAMAAPDAAAQSAEPAAPSAPVAASPEYGVDVGGALSIKTLHSRWAGIRSAHPDLFEGLRPALSLRENPQSNQPELRLLVGPFRSAEAAAQLCAALAVIHQFCQPTMFDHEVALQ